MPEKKENVPEKYKLSKSEKRELCKSGSVEIWTVQDSGKFSFMRPGITRRAEKEGGINLHSTRAMVITLIISNVLALSPSHCTME